MDVESLIPQCLSQLGSDYMEQPPTNLTGQNPDHCSRATNAKSAQIGQWCRGTGHEQRTAPLLTAITLDTEMVRRVLLHQLHATTEEMTISAMEVECPRQFLKCYSIASLVTKVIKLITAKFVKNLIVKLCLWF